MQQPATRLESILADKVLWDEATWFRAERYLLDNMSRTNMFKFVATARGKPIGPELCFKTEAVKLLRDLPPRALLAAWKTWRIAP